jgi:hypothetical protein
MQPYYSNPFKDVFVRISSSGAKYMPSMRHCQTSGSHPLRKKTMPKGLSAVGRGNGDGRDAALG